MEETPAAKDTGGAAFVPIHPNPYIVGNPVRGSAMFFGRAVEFELVRKRLSGAGGLFVFCGERRSGKTSILFQILDHRLGPEFIPVLIDMQAMAISNEADFLGKIADEILETLGSEAAGIGRPDFATATNCAASFHSFIEKVLRTHPDRKLVLLFDEYELFEDKIDSGVLSEDVLRILMSLMEKRAVFLVFTGSQNIDKRQRAYWGILSKASTFKEISYLDRPDALNLVQKPVEGVVHYAPAAVEEIYRLASGQPFYTQAICRDLIDLLNEQQTTLVTPETVGIVIERLIKNPLPQMNFHWKTLSLDEKIVLALLAEVLVDGSAFADASQLVRVIQQRKYPLDVDKPRIELALDKLFANHLLVKNDKTPPAYGFRMDLWRLWIRRVHSAYQVMREEGIDIRTYIGRKRRQRLLRGAAGALAAVVVIALALWLGQRPSGNNNNVTRQATPRGVVLFALTPPEAQIWRGSTLIGTGASLAADTIEVGRRRYRFAAIGWIDSTVDVDVDSTTATQLRVALRPLIGALYVETVPSNAEIRVEGNPGVFRSPCRVPNLLAAKPHRIQAILPGRSTRDTSVTVIRDSTLRIRIPLLVQMVEVFVFKSPENAAAVIDGSPLTTPSIQLAAGPHSLRATAPGYATYENTFVAKSPMAPIQVQLRPLADGMLVVKGSSPARMFLDEKQVVQGEVQNSGKISLRPGSYHIRIVPHGAAPIEETVLVRPDTLTTYDYDTRQQYHKPANGG